MSQLIALKWPPHAADDHRLSSLPKSGWAWEFLRRNADYQRAAAATRREMVKLDIVGSGVPVFRLHRQEDAARQWALCSFR